MSAEPSFPPTPVQAPETVPTTASVPERIFLRAGALLVAVGLALVLAGHGAAQVALDRQARTSDLLLLGTRQAALSSQISVRLERIAEMPNGPEHRIERGDLAQEIARLVELDVERDALAGEVPSRMPEKAARSGLLLGAEALTSADPAITREEALRLHRIFEAEIAPDYDLLLRSIEEAGVEARDHATLVLRTSALLQVLGLAAAGFGLLGPAARRGRALLVNAARVEVAARQRLLHDPLTGLPNATYLTTVLTGLAAQAGRRGRDAALLRVNLDRFVILREVLGQSAADDLLRIAARRITQALRPGDFAAHLGQDDFVVVATDLASPRDSALVAQRLHVALGRPFAIKGGARRVTFSIGVALLSDDAASAERLIANAEIAMSEARARGLGGGAVRYFCAEMRTEIEDREALFADLLAGLERGEIVPYFQPQIDARTRAFAGFEALARWRHPTRGLLAPSEFVDFAEQAFLSERLGEEILTRTLAALAAWDAAGHAVPRVGVNFALAQLRDPALVERIKWQVERADIDPSRIAIEVLETVFIKSDADLVVRNLRALASAGFRIELDDFGTGHASIANLRRFTVDRIKIDRSFVAGIDTGGSERSLAASMVAMARTLGIATLAEGVETDETAEAARALGFDFLQGYVIAQPMNLADSSAWLASLAPGLVVPPRAPAPRIRDRNTP